MRILNVAPGVPVHGVVGQPLVTGKIAQPAAFDIKDADSPWQTLVLIGYGDFLATGVILSGFGESHQRKIHFHFRTLLADHAGRQRPLAKLLDLSAGHVPRVIQDSCRSTLYCAIHSKISHSSRPRLFQRECAGAGNYFRQASFLPCGPPLVKMEGDGELRISPDVAE